MSLGGQFFDIGANVTGMQAQQGAQQQDLLQSILNDSSGMYDQFMQHPYQIVNLMQALLGSDARRGNVSGTATSTPGLFDYLGLGAQTLGGIYG